MFLCAGFTAGIGASGGVGDFVAKWLATGKPPVLNPREKEELLALCPNRFDDDDRFKETTALGNAALGVHGNYYTLKKMAGSNVANESTISNAM